MALQIIVDEWLLVDNNDTSEDKQFSHYKGKINWT